MKKLILCLSALLVLPILVMGFACGGGGGGASDSATPEVTLIFPPVNSLTNADFITVRGTATASSAISSLTVNGLAASTDNGFADWQAVIPLTSGVNNITVAVQDSQGHVDNAAATAQVTLFPNILYEPTGVAYDGTNNRVLAVDSELKALVGIDLADGSHAIVSDRSSSGTDFTYPQDIVLDEANNRVFLLDDSPGNEAIFAVDSTSGAKTLVSGAGVGSGPDMNTPKGMDLDIGGGRVFVVDAQLDSLFAINISDGVRTIVSGPSLGTGPAMDWALGVAYDGTNDVAYIANSGDKSILKVTLSSGNRSVVSSSTVGTGIYLTGNMNDLDLDLANNRLFVTGMHGIVKGDFIPANIIAVNLSTGARTLISNEDKGTGRTFTAPAAIDYDTVSDKLYMMDYNMDALLQIDVATGNRTVVSGSTMGGGPSFVNPKDFAIDTAGGFALVTHLDYSTVIDAVWMVDLATGDRSVLSGVGTGPGSYNFRIPEAVVVNPVTGNGLVTELADNRIVEVNISDGTRTTLSGPDTGSGPALNAALKLAVTSSGDIVYVLEGVLNGIMAVNLSSGARTIVSGGIVGSGPAFSSPTDLDLNQANDMAILADEALDAIVAVNLADGARTVISSGTVGSGQSVLNYAYARFDDSTGDIILVDSARYRLVKVDPATGDRTLIADKWTGFGPYFRHSRGVDVVDGVIYVLDGTGSGLSALMVADPMTGDRVIISK